jgi:hypothetical protein
MIGVLKNYGHGYFRVIDDLKRDNPNLKEKIKSLEEKNVEFESRISQLERR